MLLCQLRFAEAPLTRFLRQPHQLFQGVIPLAGRPHHLHPNRAPATDPSRAARQLFPRNPLLRPPRSSPSLPRLGARGLRPPLDTCPPSYAKCAAEVRELRPREPYEACSDCARSRAPLRRMGDALMGLRGSVGPAVSTIAAILSSCPELVVIDIPIPTGAFMKESVGDEDDDSLLASTHGFDLDTVRCAVRKLKRLSLAPSLLGAEAMVCKLLLRSVGSPLVELRSTRITWPSSFMALPRMDAASLRNLEVLELIDAACDFLVASLIERAGLATFMPVHHPPLAYLPRSHHGCGACLAGRPSPTRLPRHSLLLWRPPETAPAGHLHLGSSPALFARSRVQPEGPRSQLDDTYRQRPPRRHQPILPAARVPGVVSMFADLKRGFPNLRHVYVGIVRPRDSFQAAELRPKTRECLENLGVDISGFTSIEPFAEPILDEFALVLVSR
ncbi:hypothetical protein BDK51DRAFT_50432 [Blyttiomyces helicus]|uniref:Uncharacterized protein n=1 Tax=Blyttiomyces helicus TaxID=388810 RepID=A0A4P9VTU4_9FUNG|nr:hypothetical protein BDK51DRAFT_50432 [Blyttiomyces helicus]|eukprot:RKO82961.1 hypothetical protein BDK51DRAFT_50432 [Blyttiomyces helicus]